VQHALVQHCSRCLREPSLLDEVGWSALAEEDRLVWICPWCQTAAERHAAKTLRYDRRAWADTGRALLHGLVFVGGAALLALVLSIWTEARGFIEPGDGSVVAFFAIPTVVVAAVAIAVVAFRERRQVRRLAEVRERQMKRTEEDASAS
jgi:hypothetical protein